MKLPDNFEKIPDLKLSQRLGNIFHDLNEEQLEILGDKAVEARDLGEDLKQVEDNASVVIEGAHEDDANDEKAHAKLTELMYQVVSGNHEKEPDKPKDKTGEEMEDLNARLDTLKNGDY